MAAVGEIEVTGFLAKPSIIENVVINGRDVRAIRVFLNISERPKDIGEQIECINATEDELNNYAAYYAEEETGGYRVKSFRGRWREVEGRRILLAHAEQWEEPQMIGYYEGVPVVNKRDEDDWKLSIAEGPELNEAVWVKHSIRSGVVEILISKLVLDETDEMVWDKDNGQGYYPYEEMKAWLPLSGKWQSRGQCDNEYADYSCLSNDQYSGKGPRWLFN